jgi:hypothetical protein
MDDLACLGCGKTFSTQKRLSSHEVQCAEQRTLKKSLDKSRRRLDKKKRRKTYHNETHDDMHAMHEELMDIRDDMPADDIQVCLA